MRAHEIREGENLFERSTEILKLILDFPETISDSEVEGIANLVNPDMANTVRGLFKLKSARDTEILIVKRVIEYHEKVRKAKEEGKKVAFLPFTFPPEIIQMFESMMPICTELIAALGILVCAGQSERYWDFAMGMGLPDSLCSANTETVASLCMGPGLKPDVIVSNTVGTCNPNAKIHAFACDYLGIPQFAWEKPTDDSERGREQYYKYLVKLIEQLEEFAGEKLSEGRMREVIRKCNHMAELFNEFWELHKAKPSPVPNIFGIDIIVMRASLWGRQEGIDCLEKMVNVIKRRWKNKEYSAPEEVLRLFWTYIYWWFDLYNFFTWMEERGISVLGDVLGIHFLPPIDTTSREIMLRGLSDIAFDYPMTRQMGATSISVKWLDDILFAIKDLDADAAVYCGHHACKHASGAHSYIRRELMKRAQIPTLCVDGDAFNKRTTPVSVFQEEMEKFVKHAVSRRRTSRRKASG